MNLRSGAIMLCTAMLLCGCHSSKTTIKGSSAQVSDIIANQRQQPSAQAGHAQVTTEPVAQYGPALVAEARKWLGTPYAYGGHTRGQGTDCSGLVMEVYQSVCRAKLPRSSAEQLQYCTEVARNKTRVGDLVFFTSDKNGRDASRVSHVGLYIGNGEMIHASSSRGVTVSPVYTGYWGDRYIASGRVKAAGVTIDNKKSDTKTDKKAAKKAKGKKGVEQENNGKNRDESKGKKAEAVRPATMPPKDAPSIDLIDLIINQKVDSIFSSGFMD